MTKVNYSNGYTASTGVYAFAVRLLKLNAASGRNYEKNLGINLKEMNQMELPIYQPEITGPHYWQHKIKCLTCSLHFIVCSDYEDWPNAGTTREIALGGEATGLIFCPECGSTSPMLHHKEPVAGFIFQAVPGNAPFVEIR